MTIDLTLSSGVERVHGSADGRAAAILRREVDHMNSAGSLLGGQRTCPVHDANFPRGTIAFGLSRDGIVERHRQDFESFDQEQMDCSMLLPRTRL